MKYTHNKDIEESLLASILSGLAPMDEIVSRLEGHDVFSSKDRKEIWKTILDLWRSGSSPDALSVASRLGDAKVVPLIGKESLYSILAHVEVLLDEELRRKIVDLSALASNIALDRGVAAREAVQSLETAIYGLTSSSNTERPLSTAELIEPVISAIMDGSSGIAIGIAKLREILGGWRDSNLYIIGGRPSVGKTALALQELWDCANKHKVPSLFFSLEMSAIELSTRIIAMETGVSGHRLSRGLINENERILIENLRGKLREAPFFIEDTGGLSINKIRSIARQAQKEHGVKIIAVDYLQLASGDKSGNREQEISSISRGLKALSKELKLPILCLCQLNRAVEQREDGRPILSDLRESGAIEQDADTVIFVHGKLEDGERDIIVAKQRNGPIGSTRVEFHGYMNKFVDSL